MPDHIKLETSDLQSSHTLKIRQKSIKEIELLYGKGILKLTVAIEKSSLQSMLSEAQRVAEVLYQSLRAVVIATIVKVKLYLVHRKREKLANLRHHRWYR